MRHAPLAATRPLGAPVLPSKLNYSAPAKKKAPPTSRLHTSAPFLPQIFSKISSKVDSKRLLLVFSHAYLRVFIFNFVVFQIGFDGNVPEFHDIVSLIIGSKELSLRVFALLQKQRYLVDGFCFQKTFLGN